MCSVELLGRNLSVGDMHDQVSSRGGGRFLFSSFIENLTVCAEVPVVGN